jgi:hypothetical protein
MKKLCCYLGYYSKEHIIIDVSNVFRNTPKPYIQKEEDYILYPFHKELTAGQLFYYTKILKPGSGSVI